MPNVLIGRVVCEESVESWWLVKISVLKQMNMALEQNT